MSLRGSDAIFALVACVIVGTVAVVAFSNWLPLDKQDSDPSKELWDRVADQVMPQGEAAVAAKYADELPRHRVTLTEGFWIQTTEVTQRQWKAVMETAPWKGKHYLREGERFPATFVSWHDARRFCKELSEKAKGTYRLPTEAQWEYACRAGSQTAYCYGDDSDRLDAYAWHDISMWDEDYHPHAVAQKKPNAWGLYDMHGNVAEMCRGW